ncbi:polyprotein [Cucumis melo var. makuwa]|uniref:Polyprotein n=1 Tax=Cucumis melo var. makuwa TaxID=1194695 RepID=A0A5A7ULT7_CUCMM|nr:polyprotein [Cucumis melo var. makuwa]TYJ99926.1 polyprotein [Cucumis melo var. makuwa]
MKVSKWWCPKLAFGRFKVINTRIVQPNLDNGPVYFTCKLGFTVALQDKNIYDVLCLDIRAKGLRLKNRSYPFPVLYVLYYKMMYTSASPKALGVSLKNYTMLMEVNLERTRQSSTTQIFEYDDAHVEVQFQEEPYHLPIREIYSERSSISECRPTTRERPIARSNSMRMSMDLEQSILDVQYEKSEGSWSPTQTDMERKS